jgi:hypothetical protein
MICSFFMDREPNQNSMFGLDAYESRTNEHRRFPTSRSGMKLAVVTMRKTQERGSPIEGRPIVRPCRTPFTITNVSNWPPTYFPSRSRYHTSNRFPGILPDYLVCIG